jgi:hypothetical protein
MVLKFSSPDVPVYLGGNIPFGEYDGGHIPIAKYFWSPDPSFLYTQSPQVVHVAEKTVDGTDRIARMQRTRMLLRRNMTASFVGPTVTRGDFSSMSEENMQHVNHGNIY